MAQEFSHAFADLVVGGSERTRAVQAQPGPQPIGRGQPLEHVGELRDKRSELQQRVIGDDQTGHPGSLPGRFDSAPEPCYRGGFR
jgi:hypothetical protein